MRRAGFVLVTAGFFAAALAVRPHAALAHHRTPSPIQISHSGRSSGVGTRLGQLSSSVSVYQPPPVVVRVRTARPIVALTFDLDMTPEMASQVTAGVSWFNGDALDYLLAQHVHATMFMTGMWAEMYPAVARQIATTPGFEIGNHSFSHPAFHLPCYQLSSVSRSAQMQQVQMAQRAIVWVTGVTPRYFRFPGGCYDGQALSTVQAAGLEPIQWNINSIDAFNPYAAQIATTVLSQVKPGSIVLMHLQGGTNAPATAAALRTIIPVLERRGYRFVTISELLGAGTAVGPTRSSALPQRGREF